MSVPRLPAATVLAVALSALIMPGGQRSGAEPAPPFTEDAAATGLLFVHDNGARGQYYLPEIMGSGVALLDYDADGDLDVYLVQGRPLDGTPGRGQGNRLFRNDLDRAGGRLRFSDVTTAAGMGLDMAGMGAAVGDYDSDGRPDLFVTGVGRIVLYHNNGDGTFADVTAAAGLRDDRWTTSAAFLDYDRDGDLDLFVAAYVAFSITNNKICADPAGARDYCAPSSYAPQPARLYRNDGAGRFTDVSDAAGITTAFGAGLGVATGDFDGNGWIDVYVANDATPNQLWMNLNGRFEDRGVLSGTAMSAAGRPEGSMGIAAGDVDEDGDEDLFVTNLIGETHVLYLNDGRGNFEDARATSGVAGPTGPMTGFGTNWIDYDNDGRLDLLLVNGAVNIVERQRGSASPYRQRRLLLHQDAPLKFTDVSLMAGPAFADGEIGRGAAFGDLDDDGDVDVVVTNNDGPVRLLRNQTAAHGAVVGLADPGPNRHGIGALVEGWTKSGERLRRRVRADGSYLSANDTRVHFGFGDTPGLARLQVRWPDGGCERWSAVPDGAVITFVRGTGVSSAGPCEGGAPR